MSILLTHYSEECIEKFGEPCSDWQGGYDEGARAQAKKIYEWLEENKIAIDTSHNHRVESVVFDYQWRKLFKEIDDGH